MGSAQSGCFASTFVADQAAPMVYFVAVFAGVSGQQFEREDAWRVGTGVAKSTFPRLTDFALVEMALEDGKILLNLLVLVAVVDVVEVFETEEVAFEGVVDFFGEGLVHEVRVADGIVHEVYLSFEYEEVVEFAAVEDDGLVVAEFDDGALVVEADAFVGLLADLVAAQIEFKLGLVRDLDALA